MLYQAPQKIEPRPVLLLAPVETVKDLRAYRVAVAARGFQTLPVQELAAAVWRGELKQYLDSRRQEYGIAIRRKPKQLPPLRSPLLAETRGAEGRSKGLWRDWVKWVKLAILKLDSQSAGGCHGST
jgi:hypothetical protein